VSRTATEVAVVVLIVGAVAAGVLYSVVGDIDQNANRANATATEADTAAAVAVLATVKLRKTEMQFCKRLQRVRDSENRNGAIIYLILSRIAKSPARMTVAQRTRYRVLASLPLYHPRTDCQRAVDDPEYVPPAPRPYADEPYWRAQLALRRGRRGR
jgi:hypothetical protein